MFIRKAIKNAKIGKKKQAGFSLIEVMVSMIVANIALLGLVAGELKSLQYANNSYQYTISLIQANNAVERIFTDVCEFKNEDKVFNEAYVTDNLTPISGYNITFDEGVVDADFDVNFNIYVDWIDERMTDNSVNKVAVMASFPTVPAGCSANDAV